MMKRESLIDKNSGIPYLKYTPQTLPIKGSILYLHGIGERGSDITLVEHNEIPKQMSTIEVPYIVIAPQLPLNQSGWWENFTNPMVALMKTMPGHKHLTGISLGGMRSTVILAENPGVFDSASTVCGTNDVPMMGQAFMRVLDTELTRIPTTHYYDPLDKTIENGSGYTSIKSMCDQYSGIADITFNNINLPGPDHHSIWSIAYQQQNFWAWLDSKVSPLPAAVPDPVVSWNLLNGILVGTTQSGKKVSITPASIQ